MSSSQRTLVAPADPQSSANYEQVLHFDAPYLIEKLVKDRIVDTAAEGEALFAEAKKYLILSYIDSDVSWDMYSRRVDEAWHQFVLFTSQYVDFCHRYFGQYLHHNPSNAPEVPGRPELKRSTFEGFRAAYESFFGEPVPDVWMDDRSVSLSRRVINDNAGATRVSVEDEMACLAGPGGRIDVVVNEIAREALEFISCTSAFYVRELPGVLTDEEKVGLVATLVEHRVLRRAVTITAGTSQAARRSHYQHSAISSSGNAIPTRAHWSPTRRSADSARAIHSG